MSEREDYDEALYDETLRRKPLRLTVWSCLIIAFAIFFIICLALFLLFLAMLGIAPA